MLAHAIPLKITLNIKKYIDAFQIVTFFSSNLSCRQYYYVTLLVMVLYAQRRTKREQIANLLMTFLVGGKIHCLEEEYIGTQE